MKILEMKKNDLPADSLKSTDLSFGKGRAYSNIKICSDHQANQGRAAASRYVLREVSVASHSVFAHVDGTPGSRRDDAGELICSTPSGLKVKIRDSSPSADPIQHFCFWTEELEDCRRLFAEGLGLRCDQRLKTEASFDVLPGSSSGPAIRFVTGESPEPQGEGEARQEFEQIGLSLAEGELEPAQERVRAGDFGGASVTLSITTISLDDRHRVAYFVVTTADGLKVAVFGA